MFDELLELQLNVGVTTVQVSACDGSRFPLALNEWCAPADAVDRHALMRLAEHLPPRATIIDLACGPGRHAAYLAGLGMQVLGVDLAPAALARAGSGRVAVLRSDILGPLPGGNAWDAALLLDGNVGIGGEPHRLLRRAFELLSVAGRLLVEVDSGVSDRRTLQLHHGQRSSTPFAWARVTSRNLAKPARDAGLGVLETWRDGHRAFAVLGRPADA